MNFQINLNKIDIFGLVYSLFGSLCPVLGIRLFLGNTPYGIFFPFAAEPTKHAMHKEEKMHWDYYRQTHAQQ